MRCSLQKMTNRHTQTPLNRHITVGIWRIGRQQIVAGHRRAAVLQERHAIAHQRWKITPETQVRQHLNATGTHQKVVRHHAEYDVSEDQRKEDDQQYSAGAERVILDQRSHTGVPRI